MKLNQQCHSFFQKNGSGCLERGKRLEFGRRGRPIGPGPKICQPRALLGDGCAVFEID